KVEQDLRHELSAYLEVASQKCPKDNTNSSNSCSRRVSGGEYVCNGQPCVFCTSCKCLSYCWKNE
ncbi:6982_t:CDS:2, partial [Funneliformis mosseae]